MPRFGELQAAQVWLAATRTLTAFAAEDLFALPDVTSLYPPVDVTSSATANTFGSWAELVANVGAGKRLIWAWVQAQFTPTAGWEIEFGVGAAPNEARITAVGGRVVYETAAGLRLWQLFFIWRALADNARLSARARNTNAVAQTYSIVVGYA